VIMDRYEAPDYRTPPHNIEVEQALLGSILVNNEAAQKVLGFLSAEHFFEPVHGRIYGSILKLIDKNQIANPVILGPHFDNDEGLADVGGAKYLVRLAASAATIINVVDYGKTIYALALRRTLIEVGEDIVNNAYSDSESVSQFLEDAQNTLFALERDGGQEWRTKALTEVMNEVYDLLDTPDSVDFVPTGIQNLDAIIDGFSPSRLYVIGAPAGCAKTTLALNMALNVARQGHPVAFFNLEMANKEMVPRIITNFVFADQEIPYRNFARKDFSEGEWGLIRSAREQLNGLPLVVRDEPTVSISKLRRECRKLKRDMPDLKVVFIDYLQLMDIDGKDTGNDVVKYTQISRGLKLLAKELKIAVVALSQLSRTHENRENKRPQNSDLRGSGSIEQDANCVLFIYYHHKYLVRDEPKKKEDWDEWIAEIGRASTKIEIIVGKNREGAEGTAYCRYSAPAAAIR